MDPFEAPSDEDQWEHSSTDDGEFIPAPLATRAQRLLAAVVDGILSFGATSVVAAILKVEFDPAAGRVQGGLFFSAMPFTVLQWALIAIRGQTIGKLAFQIKIVRLDGSDVGFLRGVVLRTWTVLLASLACGLLGFVNVLRIFAQDRRCFHDLLAGTEVVQLHGTDYD